MPRRAAASRAPASHTAWVSVPARCSARSATHPPWRTAAAPRVAVALEHVQLVALIRSHALTARLVVRGGHHAAAGRKRRGLTVLSGAGVRRCAPAAPSSRSRTRPRSIGANKQRSSGNARKRMRNVPPASRTRRLPPPRRHAAESRDLNATRSRSCYVRRLAWLGPTGRHEQASPVWCTCVGAEQRRDERRTSMPGPAARAVARVDARQR